MRYRRLEDEGVMSDQVIESLRPEIALAALRTGMTTVRDVAKVVGFTDAAAFSRALKRRTGRIPSESTQEIFVASPHFTSPPPRTPPRT